MERDDRDTDFHPVAPTERIVDATLTLGQGRPAGDVRRPVVIENVWIGPNATILKGVHIGAGALVEAGALVTRDVLPRARIIGNPAQIIECNRNALCTHTPMGLVSGTIPENVVLDETAYVETTFGFICTAARFRRGSGGFQL